MKIPLKNKFNRFLLLGTLLFGIAGSSVLLHSCEKIEDEIDNALSFEGVFESSDGWEIELDGNSAKVTTQGTPRATSTFGVGRYVALNMKRTSDNIWEGTVQNHSFSGNGPGTVTLTSTNMTVSPEAGAPYSFARASSSGSGNGGGSGSAGPSIFLEQVVEGKERDKKIVRFTLPSGVKKMEVRIDESGGGTKQSADLFVRKGSDPTVSVSGGYTWNADCASIKPNREAEVCTFTNPGAGSWSVMLYGYNDYFYSTLKVILTK